MFTDLLSVRCRLYIVKIVFQNKQKKTPKKPNLTFLTKIPSQLLPNGGRDRDIHKAVSPCIHQVVA